MRDTQKEAETQAEGEAGCMQGAPRGSWWDSIWGLQDCGGEDFQYYVE